MLTAVLCSMKPASNDANPLRCWSHPIHSSGPCTSFEQERPLCPTLSLSLFVIFNYTLNFFFYSVSLFFPLLNSLILIHYFYILITFHPLCEVAYYAIIFLIF